MDTVVLAAADHDYLWHPYTQQRDWEHELPVFVVRGEGATLVDGDGNAYIDGTSSLGCNVHGHRHPKIDAAITKQLGQIAHSSLHGLTHPGAARLAQSLIDVAPDGLTRVFYADNGSGAVETALRMAYNYWQHAGEEDRTRFICLTNTYHGDTPSPTAVGGMGLPRSRYHSLLFEALRARPSDSCDLHGLLERHSGKVAAMIIEPLMQCSGGLTVHPPGYLRLVRDLCDEFGVLLICDETTVGLGRTGTMFASEQENVAPDLLCLGKGLTAGYLPLGATLTTESIYEAFLGNHNSAKSFAHGDAYAGNPLACSAALANLEVFEEEKTLDKLQPKIELLQSLLAKHVSPLPAIKEIRQRGFVVGIELGDLLIEDCLGDQVELAARKRGAVIRSLGNVITLMPPLSISEDELTRLVAITAAAIGESTQKPERRSLPR